MRAGLLTALALLLLACGGGSAPAPPDGGSPDGGAPDGGSPDGGSPDGGPADGGGGLVEERPYQVDVPASYDGSSPAPLIVLLHGYGATGASQDAYFGFDQLAQDRGVLVAHPDGTVDENGLRFWNATDACCDFQGTGVDDVAYLRAVLDDLERRFRIDPRRVFFVGHSNGGFMSHRMACDAADRVAAFAALAGDVWADPDRCNPSAPVAALQIHGDADGVIPYDGGAILLHPGREVPSARASVATWAAKDGCDAALAGTGERLDLDTGLPGAETRVERHACPAGAAELWTLEGGAHIPALRRPAFGDAVFEWLMRHPKP